MSDNQSKQAPHTMAGPKPPPVVCCFSGFDPTGGAGIQADIEAIKASGCHAIGAISCLTVQNTRGVESVHPIDPTLFRRQCEQLLADIQPAVFKIGLIGDARLAIEISHILSEYPEQAVVIDPVLAAGGGGAEASDALIQALVERLLPRASLITPNIPEFETLTQAGWHACREQWTLITGTHSDSTRITHRLLQGADEHIYENARLDGDFHGSGCTLASYAAASLAHGLAVPNAVATALEQTFQALQGAFRIGHGQQLPVRSSSC